MSSIIAGYNYDIFISYRQKDNKHDGWVTKFVDNLKGELEATFKEDISVYFDENPHDRLQETHNVDKSLEGKLKCVIFIPILSQTYCDPNSYAWQYEFLAFLKMAEKDQFGRDIKLRSGNVASRILPTRIHDLEQEDIKLFEKETGSVVRAMDFVFKTASGVNRPLKANEDHPQDNLNKTFYSDQINKVANAIKEIIMGMKAEPDLLVKCKHHLKESLNDDKKCDSKKEVISKEITNHISKKWLILILSALFCIICVFAVFKFFEGRTKDNDIAKLEKSIAVLPFVNDSPDQENTYFINGIMDEILNNLQKIKDFRVLSRTSTEQYRSSNKSTIPKIAKELDVNYIVEGSGQKYGNKFVLRVQLITAKNEKHLWGESFEREIKETSDIINIQSQIALLIATELKVLITPEEKQLIDKKYTTNLSAYDLFLRARNEHMKYWMGNSNIDGLNIAMILYRQSLQYDSTYAQAYSGLALGYMNKNSVQTDLKTNFVDSMIIYANKALNYNERLDEAYFVKGAYYDITGDYKRALKEYNKSIKINPSFSWAYFSRAWLHFQKTYDIFSAFDDNFKAIQLEHGPLRSGMMRSLGYAFDIFGLIINAKYYYEEALKLDNDSISYLNSLAFSESYLNDPVALELSYKVLKKDPSNLDGLLMSLNCYERLGRYEDAYNTALNILNIWKENGYSPQEGWGQIGYAFWKTGHLKEAKHYFDKQINIIEKILDLDPNDNNIKMPLAEVYAVLGEKEKVLHQVLDINYPSYKDWQKNESHIGSVIYLYFLKYDPMLENLRSDPSFQKFVSNYENIYNITHERFKDWLEKKGMLKE